MELDEVGEDRAEIVEGVRAARVARHHDALQRRQVAVDLGPETLELGLQSLELAIDVDLPLLAEALQLVDLALELEQRLLELQGVG